MKTSFAYLFTILLVLTLAPASAAVRYVNLGNLSPEPPYTTWATAATVIQDAIDASGTGDEVVVTNGVYAVGGRTAGGDRFHTNRIAVTGALRVRSVNGPLFTTIRGHQVPGTKTGDAAVRCAFLVSGAELSGFTLANGATGPRFNLTNDYWELYVGGGVYCQDSGALVSNCRLIGNVAGQGGGAYLGTLRNCLIVSNTAVYFGGAVGTLNNCTVIGNTTVQESAGPTAGYLNNCIVYHNLGAQDMVYSTLNYSCAPPGRQSGANNITDEPQLTDLLTGHLAVLSPCRGRGNPAFASGVDIDGQPWAFPPSIGCDEFRPITEPLTVGVRATRTNVLIGTEVTLTPQLEGQATSLRWYFGDGTVISNEFSVSHHWTNVGRYNVVLTAFNDAHPEGVTGRLDMTVTFEVQFTSTRSSVWETGRVATIRVVRGGFGPEVVTVDYATSDGTATAGQDYTATRGTLTFGPGEAEKSFTIPILDDALPERGETVRLSLSGLTGPAVFGAMTNTLLAIIDDDTPPNTNVTASAISAGENHTLALRRDGSLWAWGENHAGQLGDGTTEFQPDPVLVECSINNWCAMAAGESFSLALKTDGSLWAWGWNGSGELGLGRSGEPVLRPARIGSSAWAAIAASWDRSLAVRWDGSLWTWGRGVMSPLRVGEDNDWRSVATGLRDALALKTDGSLWALEFGAPPAARPVGTDHDWLTITTGGVPAGEPPLRRYAHAVASKTDGSLWAWGDNRYGQLGDGSMTFQPDPVRIGNDDDWLAITTGAAHTMALKRDGTLWGWGNNDGQQLGDGTRGNRLEPTQIGSDTDWVAVDAGGDLTVAIKSDGSLWRWGFQLGVRSPTSRVGTDNDWGAPPPGTGSGIVRFTGSALEPGGQLDLFFATTLRESYYLLLRGDAPADIRQTVAATLGDCAPLVLTDPASVSSRTSAFYRIRAVPTAQPLDSDGDGIDDVYELRHRPVLHPLNPSDAAENYDGDGRSNLLEYLAGTDPAFRPQVLSAGVFYTVLLKADGSLWSLGDGPATNSTAPARLGPDSDWASVAVWRDAARPGAMAALKRDGSLWLGTGDAMERLGFDSGWKVLSAGGTGLALVKTDGSLWTWTGVFTRVGTDSDWFTVSAGGGHIVALKIDGSLWVWGDNAYSQLGDGTTVLATVPQQVGIDTDWTEFSVQGGASAFTAYAAALKRDRSLWAWGSLDNRRFTPGPVDTNMTWAAQAANFHTVALQADASLWAWGANWAGQLGDGTTTNRRSPARISSTNNWAVLAAGEAHTLGLQADGSLWSWGANYSGQLGDGTLTNQFSPVRVGSANDWSVIAAGFVHSVALKNDGTLWSWGDNYYGQLGGGIQHPTNQTVPLRIGSDTDWAFVVTRGWHTVAFKRGGSLWAWGVNWNGQLGDGTTMHRPSPVRVGVDNNWTAIAAGYNHTLALKSDGSLWGWGVNNLGQLGDGLMDLKLGPVRIGQENNWATIAAGGCHTLGLKTDGSLWAWGCNALGQVGDGGFDRVRPIPVRIGSDTDWVSITAGGAHSLARKTNSTLWSWGWNQSGQLGIPFVVLPHRLSPDTDWGSPP